MRLSRKRIPPMPVEEKIDSQLAMTFPPSPYGMFSRICEHFWASGCKPLPVQTEQLRGIARAHAPTWRTWEAQIMQAFEEIRPRMEHALERRENSLGNLERLRERARAAQKAKRLVLQAGFSEMSTSASLIAPKRKAVNKQQSIAQSTPADNGFVDAA